jgi:hypothetical protein
MFPGMPEDQQRAAAMRMAMGILANNTESRPGAGNAFGRAMAGGMDEGALYANQVAQQQRMAQQMEQQQQMMEMQKQKMVKRPVKQSNQKLLANYSPVSNKSHRQFYKVYL